MGLDLYMVFQRGTWLNNLSADDPYLSISIHDSDIAEVRHAPTSAVGLCFLGVEPRFYFDEPDQNLPVDRAAEAESLARWAHANGNASVTPNELFDLMANPDEEDSLDDFVEDSVVKLCLMLGIPIPPALA